MITTTEEKWLPEKIYPVNYAGFWDFSPDGTYGDSLINVMDFPTAEQIANEIAKRYNDHSTLTEQNAKLKRFLHSAYQMDFEKFPLPICSDPSDELHQLHQRSNEIGQHIESLLEESKPL